MFFYIKRRRFGTITTVHEAVPVGKFADYKPVLTDNYRQYLLSDPGIPGKPLPLRVMEFHDNIAPAQSLFMHHAGVRHRLNAVLDIHCVEPAPDPEYDAAPVPVDATELADTLVRKAFPLLPFPSEHAFCGHRDLESGDDRAR